MRYKCFNIFLQYYFSKFFYINNFNLLGNWQDLGNSIKPLNKPRIYKLYAYIIKKYKKYP